MQTGGRLLFFCCGHVTSCSKPLLPCAPPTPQDGQNLELNYSEECLRLFALVRVFCHIHRKKLRHCLFLGVDGRTALGVMVSHQNCQMRN